MVAVGLVGAALTAQRGDGGGKRHLAAGANGKTLEGAPLVGGLGRALVLAVEEEAHDLTALVGGKRLSKLELAVVDDAVDPAEAAVVLEHDVAGPGRSSLLEEHAHPPRRRRLDGRRPRGRRRASIQRSRRGWRCCSIRLAGTLPSRRSASRAARRRLIALVAFRDQAAPVGMDGAHTPDPVVHGGVADQCAAPLRQPDLLRPGRARLR